MFGVIAFKADGAKGLGAAAIGPRNKGRTAVHEKGSGLDAYAVCALWRIFEVGKQIALAIAALVFAAYH